MFWAMAQGLIDTGGRRYVHELGDIESLNRRALAGELQGTPGSLPAPAYLSAPDGPPAPGGRRYVHELGDIESLNRRALAGELEVTAVSLHAYAYLSDRYALLAHGASIGDRYGPRIVSRVPAPRDARSALAGKLVAVPGELTTAFLTLRLYQPDVRHVVVPFDQ